MTVEEEKQRLIKQMGSKDNEEALAAVDALRDKGWLLVEEADLSDANLCGANLYRADLRGADLRRANLNGADLRRANLNGAFLIEADLRRANLNGAFLIEADLRRTNLNGANLHRANLQGAKLYMANLQGTNLRRADLYSANLRQADLTDSKCLATRFSGVDMSTVKGLETARHYGPSTVGVDTLYKSNGKIPEVFLRGCGVPDEFLEFTRGLFSDTAINYSSCFISYSSPDQAFSDQLHARLLDAGLRVWYAPEDVAGGKKLHEQIYHAIDYHDRLLVVLSEHSIRSEWVMTELRRARKLEVEQGVRKLFLISLTDYDTLHGWQCFDADTGKDLAVEVREYFIPDFSDWQTPESFEPAFQRLLKDLKAADTE